MKVPCCSVCQTRYNEQERVPLLLQCGHGFCKECLSRMFSSSLDTSLACPRCRHVSVVGNSVQALRKNYAVLALIHSNSRASGSFSPAANNLDFDYTDDEEEEGEEEDVVNLLSRRSRRSSCVSMASSSSGCGPVIEVGVHQELKLVKMIGEGRRAGVEMWTAVIGGGGGMGRCRHQVATKKVVLTEEMKVDWVIGQLENLRRASMWCRNVCTFHGVTKLEGALGIIMDKCNGSVQSEMQLNEGRLTLEQILRYGADIALGVAELHAAGVVCMNLKPSNLLLDSSGHAMVSDYGLAAILKKSSCRKARPDCDTSRIHSCMECTMLSPHYAAPEAWEPVKKSLNLFWDDAFGISAESDAWSFGCTLVEMCTGSVPWAGLSAEEIYRAVVKSRKLPPQYASVVGVGIPGELWKMIGECLQFKAARRPTFNAMLTIFLRHLQEIPCSPPTSPDNGFVKCAGPNVTVESSPLSDLETSQVDPSSLHRLVSQGDASGTRDLLAKAASANANDILSSVLAARNAEGQTALHLACRRGSAELVEAILEYEEAHVDIPDKDGDPPLVFALAAGSPECVSALIQRGANVRSLRNGCGPSVAHACAYHGQPDCMHELLMAGADPNAVDDEIQSVLHRAVAKKFTDCAIVILENGGCRSMGFLDSNTLTPLHLCIATWNVAVVRRWVEVAMPEEIADAIDVLSRVGTALCMAAGLKKNHEIEGREMVQILLSAGADPTAQDLQHARTALHTAAMANDVELVKIILNAGVDVNIRNVHNTIPLHVALARGANSCVGLLLSSGANYNLQDDEGDNAFHIAAEAAKMIRENLHWLIVMLRNPDAAVEVRNHRQVSIALYIVCLDFGRNFHLSNPI